MRYMGKQDVAEDLMISSFMRIFEKIDTYKGEGNFEGWMRRIVVNQCLSELRKQRNMYVAISMEEAVAMPDINLLESHLAAEELLQLVTDLPIGYRTVFNLYAIEGYSHKEIAEQLGINENTSKSQLSRARVHLQQALKKMEEAINVKKESHGEK
jgi:RNA polymerase sigma-70 factor (ECF subfamily)